MHKIRHLEHQNRLTTEGGFRLIRHFSPAHNRRRLDTYIAALWKTPDLHRWRRWFRMRQRAKASS